MNKTVSNPHSTTRLIIVMGVSGCGKSTLAQALAAHYHIRYLEADDFHSMESKELMKNGIALTDEQRTPWVASIKTCLIGYNHAQNHCVLAFSGLRTQHRMQLREAGLKTLFLFLQGNQSLIYQRMLQRKHHYMPASLLDSQFASLEDPSHEQDVYTLSIDQPENTVLNEAISAINHFFNS